MKTKTVRNGLLVAGGVGLGAGAVYGLVNGLRNSRKRITVRRSVDVAARVERVFDFWMEFENFPDWMSHVRSVEDLDGVRSHWVVDGPLNAPIQWDAVVTQITPGRLIAWQTAPGSLIQHDGTVRFTSNRDRSTHVDVTMSFTAPGGELGRSLARLFGADPAVEMEDDLLRLKALIETGSPDVDLEELRLEMEEAPALRPVAQAV